MDELIEMYAGQLARAYLNRAGDQQIYEMAIGMFDRIVSAERERCAALCKELTDRRVAEMGLTEEGAAHLTGYQCVAVLLGS